jgi:hypothetical protein
MIKSVKEDEIGSSFSRHVVQEECLWDFDEKDRDHHEGPAICGRMIFKWILRDTGWGVVDWIDMPQDRNL